jgi:outer membrane protein OmpA-like peptidoglycan-associated protein
MITVKRLVPSLFVALLCVLMAAGCASRRGAKTGDSSQGATGGKIAEPKEGPKAEEVLPGYVPERTWEYESMPEPQPSDKPSAKIDDVSFDDGGTTLTREGLAICRRIGEWMQQNPKLGLLIVGHASRIEGGDDGLALGRKRAEAARECLTRDHGIPESRIQVASFGNRFSKADASEPGLQKVERRVEFWSVK